MSDLEDLANAVRSKQPPAPIEYATPERFHLTLQRPPKDKTHWTVYFRAGFFATLATTPP